MDDEGIPHDLETELDTKLTVGAEVIRNLPRSFEADLNMLEMGPNAKFIIDAGNAQLFIDHVLKLKPNWTGPLVENKLEGFLTERTKIQTLFARIRAISNKPFFLKDMSTAGDVNGSHSSLVSSDRLSVKCGYYYLDLLVKENVETYRNFLFWILETLAGVQLRLDEPEELIDSQTLLFLDQLSANQVPEVWKSSKFAYKSISNLSEFFDDLVERINYIEHWHHLHQKGPKFMLIHDISKVHDPAAFINAILLDSAIQLKEQVENFEIELGAVSSKPIIPAERGVYVTGLNLVGATFDIHKGILKEAKLYEKYSPISYVN